MLSKMRRNFILLVMVVALISVAVFLFMLYGTTRQSLVQQSETRLEALLSGSSADHASGGHSASLDVQIPCFSVYVNGFNQISLEQCEYYDLDKEQLVDIVTETMARDEDYGELEQYHLRYQMRGNLFGVRIAYVDTSIESGTLRTVVLNGLLMGAGALVVFFIISLFISGQIVKPIKIAWAQQKQFVADASHELKTPLTVILANAELLSEESAGCSEQGKKWVENIRAEGTRMRRLVESLLDQARADTGEEAHFGDVDFTYLVNESVLTFEPVAFEAGKHIEAHVDDGVHVRGNPDSLKQLLSILLDNGLKYAYPDTAILVELLVTGKKTALLRVSDIGPEIPPEDHDKIFTRFYRSDAARQADGSYGLGLSIAKSITELHGGSIGVESGPEYTAFSVSLPVAK